MLISALFFSLMAFILKKLYQTSAISTYEVTYWQSMIMITLNFSLFKVYQKDHMQVPSAMRGTLVFRSITAFLGITGFYLALQYTDLSKATALYWTNPMMTAVISYCVLNEHINFIDWLAIFISFFGVIVIQNPWSITALTIATDKEHSMEDLMGSLAAIGGAIFFAISQMQTRKMGKKVHFLVPPFY